MFWSFINEIYPPELHMRFWTSSSDYYPGFTGKGIGLYWRALLVFVIITLFELLSIRTRFGRDKVRLSKESMALIS